jgi:hypothetical protein
MRPARNTEGFEKLEEKADKLLGRIYLLWLFGIIAGAVRLRPQSITIAGAAFGMENPAIVEGLLYLGCICIYVAIFVHKVLSPHIPTGYARGRNVIYMTAKMQKIRTLRNLDSTKIAKLKQESRSLLKIMSVIWIAKFSLPFAHITIFRHHQLIEAIIAIFTRSRIDAIIDYQIQVMLYSAGIG